MTTEPQDGEPLRAWLDSMRFMLRVEVADVTDRFAVLGEPYAAESAPGEPLAWRDPWPALVGDTAAYGVVDGHPGADRTWRELIVPREGLAAAVGDRPLAGSWAAEALRVAAWRRVSGSRPTTARSSTSRLAAHRRPPAQGLLPRAGDRRACAQPRSPAAPARLPPPRRVRARPARARQRGRPRRAGRRVPHLRRPAPRDGPIGLALVKRSTPVDATLTVDGIAAAQTVVVTP